MPEVFYVLALAALPAAGNLVGGLTAEAVPVSERTLSLALHAAAGIVLAVVGVELMPRVLSVEPAWLVILALMAGGVFFVLADKTIDVLNSRFGSEGAAAGPWAIFFAVSVDLFSDGLMIGTGSTLDLRLGLLLALGQVSADLPEGFATIASLRRRGIPRRWRLLLSLSFALPVLVGALIGYFVVRGGPELLKMLLLAFTAGILVTVTVEELVPQAHEGEEARSAALFFIGGFALFTFLSVYLG